VSTSRVGTYYAPSSSPPEPLPLPVAPRTPYLFCFSFSSPRKFARIAISAPLVPLPPESYPSLLETSRPYSAPREPNVIGIVFSQPAFDFLAVIRGLNVSPYHRNKPVRLPRITIASGALNLPPPALAHLTGTGLSSFSAPLPSVRWIVT